MSPEQKLAYMANQIGRFFETQPHADAVAAIEEHLRKFWDPRMRRMIVASLDQATPTPAAPVPHGRGEHAGAQPGPDQAAAETGTERITLDPPVRAAVERLRQAAA